MGDNNREQSMEEILASIKRVISEDMATPPAPPLSAAKAKQDQGGEAVAAKTVESTGVSSAEAAATGAEDEDVLDLVNPVGIASPPPASPAPASGAAPASTISSNESGAIAAGIPSFLASPPPVSDFATSGRPMTIGESLVSDDSLGAGRMPNIAPPIQASPAQASPAQAPSVQAPPRTDTVSARVDSPGPAPAPFASSSAPVAAPMARSGPGPDFSSPDGGPLEAAVRDMLQPMLKQWLDQRLPGIIEDIVKREVNRITSGTNI